MTPALEAWATRHGRGIGENYCGRRDNSDPAAYLASELRKSGPLLSALLRREVERAFWARLAEHEEARDG